MLTWANCQNYLLSCRKYCILKGSYDIAKKNIMLCIWCNAMCLCSLRFKKHIIFHIMYIIVAPHLSETFYKAHRSKKWGAHWLASYPVHWDWLNTSSVWRKCYATQCHTRWTWERCSWWILGRSGQRACSNHVTTLGWTPLSSTVKANPAIHSAKLMYFLSDQHGSAPGMTKRVSSSFGRPNKVVSLSQQNIAYLSQIFQDVGLSVIAKYIVYPHRCSDCLSHTHTPQNIRFIRAGAEPPHNPRKEDNSAHSCNPRFLNRDGDKEAKPTDCCFNWQPFELN